ncbi:glycine oxidase thio [Tribonema minus]|uniref:Glycine oxidase thio n=1 Tax=Tribonema minus TaxID=303371 RepID=A0A835ZBS5_9STRA|nr:glycine oxidase thio [Tribonema minus]
MLAPQSERLESGHYLNLCLQSRAMYPAWIETLESLAGIGVAPGTPPPDAGFWSAGGFLAPAFAGDEVSKWVPPPEGGPSEWLTGEQLRQMEPLISEEAVGGWWYPQDMNVDARCLFDVLERAAVAAGVEVMEGTAARGLVYNATGKAAAAVVLSDGRQVKCEAVVGAMGAWMRELLPVPMTSHKGQMMALRSPSGLQKAIPGRVLFAEDAYIIPKRDGRVVVGATVERDDWSLHTTPAGKGAATGLARLIANATKVCPALAHMAIEETWAGLRPVAPDSMPVLGASERCRNVFLAGGYWRNGVLLAPRTGQLVADAVMNELSVADRTVLGAFSSDRFLGARKGAAAERSLGGIAVGFAGTVSKGASKGGMAFDGLYGMFGAGGRGYIPPELEHAEEEARGPGADAQQARDAADAQQTQAEALEESEEGPVTDYDAMPEFSEEALKEARRSNRNLDEIFSSYELDAQDQSELAAADATARPAYAWDDDALSQAQSVGAELVEVELSAEEHAAVESAGTDTSALVKLASVVWQRPEDEGGPLRVPFGTNVLEMAQEGRLAELAAAGSQGTGAQEISAPSAARGEQERSQEVSALYAKILENKRAAAAAAAPAKMMNGSSNGSAAAEANGWLSRIFNANANNNSNHAGVNGSAPSGGPVLQSSQVNGHAAAAAAGAAAAAAATAVVHDDDDALADAKEASFDAYDAIMVHRGEQEGGAETATAARASNRLDADAEWAAFEAAFEGRNVP